ncbi:MAG: FAD-dependent oxidoreductase [Candidatus Promineifilaceae bacterium]
MSPTHYTEHGQETGSSNRVSTNLLKAILSLMLTYDYLILGGGIAGLAAATELLKRGHTVLLIEKGAEVGGLARTFAREGFRFDLGGHRFHSNNPAVVQWLKNLLGDDLLRVPRLSHIYLEGRFVDYPLQFPGALTAFPPRRAAALGWSYLTARVKERGRADHSFEDWVVKRFGQAMYATFFQPYTQKVWGIPGHEISAAWAAQRIGLPNLWQAVRHALLPATIPPATAISHFYYPRTGFGLIPQTLRHQIEQQRGTLLTQTSLAHLEPTPDGFWVYLAGTPAPIQARQVISTIPLEQLVAALPQRETGRVDYHLDYRGLICVFLALARPQITRDSWTYFPNGNALFGRTHEPKNWSADMVPGPDVTSLAVEIFTNPHEEKWQWSDNRLVQTVVEQLTRLHWFRAAEVRNSWVVRVPHAYPVYRVGYEKQLAAIKTHLCQWPRLHLLGRTGSFRYLNSDGVIEDVFRFIEEQEGVAAGLRPLANGVGRWV